MIKHIIFYTLLFMAGASMPLLADKYAIWVVESRNYLVVLMTVLFLALILKRK